MKMKDFNMDELLRHSLTQPDGPSDELNQSIKNRIEKEHVIMNKNIRKLIPIPLLVVFLTLFMSLAAFAAWSLLTPKDVVEKYNDNGLAAAFQSKDAVEINETILSGGYKITFLGVVSGEGLSDFKGSAHEINPSRTYAVVAIAKEDGSPMPATSDPAYADKRFFVSPLIKGEQPWLCNIATMKGSYTETVADGIMYRLLECDDIEIFADRGLYLCVSDTTFYSVEAFNYDSETGEVRPNPEFNGVNALFDLPLDISKADPEKAEKYLQEMYSEDDDSSDAEESSEDIISDGEDAQEGPKDVLYDDEDIEALMESAVLIPESVKEVSYTETGSMVYEFEGKKLVCDVQWIFPEGTTGPSQAVGGISENDSTISINCFNMDEKGVITGMIYKVTKEQ